MTQMDFRKVIPNLRPDESVYVFTRSSVWAFLSWIAIGILLFILGVIMGFLSFGFFPEFHSGTFGYNVLILLGAAYFLLLLPFLAVAFIDLYYDIHVVTSHRLVDINQHSLFVREINELALEEVQDVTVEHKGILGSTFDFGRVSVETAGAHPNFIFDNIHYPREVANIILDMADQAKMRLQRGEDIEVKPRCEVMGVIESKAHRSLDQMVDMGAVKNGKLASSGTAAPAASATTVELGIPGLEMELQDQISQSVPAPLSTPTLSETKKEKPAPKSNPEPAPAKPIQKQLEPQTKPKEDTSGDLDIVIDDPNHPPKS